MLIIFTSCVASDNNLEKETIYIIASKKADCQGVALQKCFFIKKEQQENWHYFYSTIKGFNYEEGFEYEILVSEKQIENPPQDASSIAYTFVKIISKVEKTSENLPN